MIPICSENFSAQPRLIFMGTPDFSVPTLQSLIENRQQVLAVVTQPDRPKGRGKQISASPIKETARKHGLTVLQPEKASQELFCEQIKALAPDLIIVIAYGQILKKNLLAIPKWGVVNIHASLLPKYRGAAPIQWAILNNETLTGLTVMQVDEGLDTGPILDRTEVPILPDETGGSLHDRLALKAGEVMIKWLRETAGHCVQGRPQDQAESTYAPKIERELARVDWQKPAEAVNALIRGLDPKPGAYTTFAGQELKLFASRVQDAPTPGCVPGRVKGNQTEGLPVETAQGTVVIREVQYPGKKRMGAVEFLRGFGIPVGTLLGR